jgi:competence protein ComFC
VINVPEPICQVCGLPLRKSGICRGCKNSPPSYKKLRSWVIYEGPIRKALHSLKYNRNVALGDALAPSLANFVDALGWMFDSVVPVPLGMQRRKERGYNQVALVAKPLAGILGKKYAPDMLTRTRETPSQVGLSYEERKQNMLNAFLADFSSASQKEILLVDDIATTGSTLASCSDALIQAGAKTVFAITLARALPRHGTNIV